MPGASDRYDSDPAPSERKVLADLLADYQAGALGGEGGGGAGVTSVDGDIGPTVVLPTDAAANVGSKRTLGTGPLQAVAGNDPRLTALNSLVIAPGVAGVVGDGVAFDTTAIQAILASIPQTATAYGADVVVKRGIYKVHANSIKVEVANTRLIFEGGAEFICPTAGVGDRVIHVGQWYVDIVGQPKVSGSGSRGNGIGIALGPTTSTRYPTSIGSTDSGVHGCLVESPTIANCEAGIEFGVGSVSGNSGDNTIVGGRISSCQDGVRSRGFTNNVIGSFISSCNYGVRVTNDNSSGRVDCTDLTIADCYLAPVKIERGAGTVFRGLWLEQQARTASEALIVVGTSTTSAHGVRFEGPTNVHFNSPQEDYGVRIVNGANFYMEDAVMSVSTGAGPGVALLYLDSTCSGRNNVIERAWYKGTVPATWTHSKALVKHASATGEGIVRQVPDMAGAPLGSTIGPCPPTRGADYTLARSPRGTFYAVLPSGHVHVVGADVGGFPSSYVTGTLPAGSGLTGGQQTTSGLQTVVDAIKGSSRHISFVADTFNLGFNRNLNLSGAYSDLVLSGAGPATIIQNYCTGGGDTEPLSFTGGSRIHIRDMTVSSGGDSWGGASGISGDSCDAIDCDSWTDGIIERVRVIASRDRAIIFDGGNTASTDNTPSSSDNIVRNCLIDGTRPAAPTGTPTATAQAGGALTSRAYTYSVTQIMGDYRESASLLVGTVTPSGSQLVRVTKPTLAAGAIGWKIYRASTTGTADQFQMVAAVFDLGLTSFDDNVPDDSTGIGYNGTDSASPTKYIPELSLLQLGTVRIGLESLAAHRVTFENNDIVNTASSGILVASKNNSASTARVRPDNCVIRGNRIRGAKGSGVLVTGGSQTLVVGNRIVDCGASAAQAVEQVSSASGTNAAYAISLTRGSASTFGENQFTKVIGNTVRDTRAAPTTSGVVSLSATNGGATGAVIRDNDWQGVSTSTGISDSLGVGGTSLWDQNTVAETKTTGTSATVLAWEKTIIASAATQTVTLPSAAARPGRRIQVVASNASPTVTVAPQSGDTIRGSASLTVQWASRTYEADGTTNWVLVATSESGGGGGAPTDAPYVTLAAHAGLSAESVLGSAVNMRGLFADRPAAGIAGREYTATDGTQVKYRDNGSSWDPVSPGLNEPALQQVAKAGTLVGTRHRLNFIEGSNVTLTVADDGANDEVDITIAAAGGSGTGMELLGSATLGTQANTMSAITIAARDHLQIVVLLAGYDSADIPALRFGTPTMDAAANYSDRHLHAVTGGATLTNSESPSATAIRLGSTNSTQVRMIVVNIGNLAASKKVATIVPATGSANAATASIIALVGSGVWHNTTDQITAVQLRSVGANLMAVGTKILIYGKNV